MFFYILTCLRKTTTLFFHYLGYYNAPCTGGSFLFTCSHNFLRSSLTYRVSDRLSNGAYNRTYALINEVKPTICLFQTINPTNGSSYTWTVLQSQQVASSRLRAIETGRWVVQVSPTGFSAFVDPEGHVHQRTGVSEQKVISSHVAIRSGKTIYVALGDKPWVVLIALVFLLAILNRSKSRSRSRS
jgi:hypothetical protein